jgi:hypothetical protein
MAIITNTRGKYVTSDRHEDERVSIAGRGRSGMPLEVHVISRRHGVEVLGLPAVGESVYSLSSKPGKTNIPTPS